MAISFFGFCVGIRVFPVAGFIVKSYSMGRNHPPERWLASLAWAKQSVSRFERFLSAFVILMSFLTLDDLFFLLALLPLLFLAI